MTDKGQNLKMEMVSISDLRPSKSNVRSKYDFGSDPEMKSLIDSIKERGVLVPLTVRGVTGEPHESSYYEIAAGHRRYHAAKAAKLEKVPCMIRRMDDREFLEVMITDNLQRKDIHPLDEATGYRSLYVKQRWDIGEIARRLGKTEDYVARRMKLTDLVPGAQKAFRSGWMLMGHAEALCRMTPKDQRTEMTGDERYVRVPFRKGNAAMPTVTEYERHLRDTYMLKLGEAPFSRLVSHLLPDAGACTTCPKRTGCVQSLFPDIKSKDTCTDPKCYKDKVQAHVVREVKAGRLPVSNSSGAGCGAVRYPGAVIPTKWTEPGGKRSWGGQPIAKCKNGKPAVISDGERKGEIITACFDEKCKTHWKKQVSRKDQTNMNSEHNQKKEKDEPTWEQRQQAEAELVEMALADEQDRMTEAKPKIDPDAIMKATKALVTEGVDHKGMIWLANHMGVKGEDSDDREKAILQLIGGMSNKRVHIMLMLLTWFVTTMNIDGKKIYSRSVKIMKAEKKDAEEKRDGDGGNTE